MADVNLAGFRQIHFGVTAHRAHDLLDLCNLTLALAVDQNEVIVALTLAAPFRKCVALRALIGSRLDALSLHVGFGLAVSACR